MKIAVNDVELNYQKFGSGHPLILLHGNEEDGSIFDKISSPLSLYFTVYVLDARGHGGSSREDLAENYHYQTFVDDLREFIAKLALQDPYIFGFSDGGIIALMLASQNPDLISKLMVAGVNVTPDGLVPSLRLKYRFLNSFKRSPEIDMMLDDADISDDSLRKIKAETLCVVGEKDVVKVEHTRKIAERIPNSRIIVMPKQNHSSYVVHSLKLLTLMKDFFK